MLIKALNDYYDILSKSGNVCPDGCSVQKITHLIMLKSDGTISDILDIRRESEPDKKGKTKLLPVETVMPARSQKPGIDANIIEHRPLYIFGLNYDKDKGFSPSDATDKALKSHNSFVEKNLEFIDGMESEESLAYRAFIQNWTPENEINNENLMKLGKEYNSAYFSFALDGCPEQPFHSADNEIMKQCMLSDNAAEKSETDDMKICAVSGEKGKIARIHDKIKGIRGGQASGGPVVCFNSTAEESYGKTQSFNSSISENTMKHYTEVLNKLTADPMHRFYLDDVTIVFWAMTPNDSREADVFLKIIGMSDEKADANETNKIIENAIKALSEGKTKDLSGLEIDENVMFYIAGLAPNNSRIAQKFIYCDKFGKIFENTARHQADMFIDGTKTQIPMWRLFIELKSPKSTKDKVSPPLQSSIFKSVINGTQYPVPLLETVVRRVKTDKTVNYVRAGVIKACLNRKTRLYKGMEEIKVALDRDNKNQAYLCGRLFAVLERIQQNATEGKLNHTIKDAYFASACSKPSVVFPNLMKLSQHHLRKDKYSNEDGWLVREITDKMGVTFPQTLSLNDQGTFILGYYHQYQDFFKKHETKDNKTINEENND